MANTHETLEDIIAEKRRQADTIERDCAEKMKRGEMISDCYDRELVADIRREADRLDAAHKREITILRDALAEVIASIEVRFPAIEYALDRKPYLDAKKILEQYEEEATIAATDTSPTSARRTPSAKSRSCSSTATRSRCSSRRSAAARRA